MNSVELRRCPRCGETKPLTVEFWNKDRTRKDGFHGWCRICKKADHKVHYNNETKTEHRIKQRLWRSNNRERVREYVNKSNKKIVLMLKPTYIKHKLRLANIEPTPELIELKRLQIITLRNLKKLRRLQDGPTNKDTGREQQEDGINNRREV